MRFNLLPREERFFEDFNEQTGLILQAARTLRECCENWELHAEKFQQITDLEHQADEIVHTVVVRINKTFVTPIDREDLHAITCDLDDIVDYIHGLAMRMSLFKIDRPTPQSIELAHVLEKSVEVVVQGVQELSTFNDVTALKKQMQTLEKQGDQIYRQALADLFDTSDCMHVLKWKEIYDLFEVAIDGCEDVFDVIEGIMVKHS